MKSCVLIFPRVSNVLFLIALYYWGPSVLVAMLPAANVMEWRDSSHLTPPIMGDSEKGQTPTDTDSQVVFSFQGITCVL